MGTSAVVFQADLGFQGVVDRFDDLSEASELGCAATATLVGACESDEFDAVFGESAFELARGVSLVGDDGLAGTTGEQTGFGLDQIDRDVSFVEFRVRQRERDRQPGRCAHEVQAQPPEVAGMRRAVAVAGPASKVGAVSRWAAIGCTRPAASRSTRCRRPTRRCLRRAGGSSLATAPPTCATVCCIRPDQAGTGTDGTDARWRSAAIRSRWRDRAAPA